MTSKAVAKQLAMKLKLEDRLKPKLRKFFRQMGHDVKIVMTVTNRVPSLDSFDAELITILREHYRLVAEAFKEIPKQSIKSSITINEKKQHFEEIPGGSDSSDNTAFLAAAVLLLSDAIDKSDEEIVEFIISHSVQQSGFILRTTQKELQAITARVIANAIAQGEDLTLKEIAARVEKEFNASSAGRIDTIAATETQGPSETTKLIIATVLAATVIDVLGPDGGPVPGTVIKTWNTIIDSVTRPAHIRANGQTIRNNTAFVVGGERLPAPGNSSLGASLKNVINCRCTATYSVVGGDALPVNITLQ